MVGQAADDNQHLTYHLGVEHAGRHGTDLAAISGTYGDYLLNKVSKVFPELGREHLRRPP
jgi:hypothetical protein